jgi:hypothetical protein
MKKIVALMLAAASCLLADVSGKWTGGMQDDPGKPVFLVFKQDGATLTGSGGPNEGEQLAMRNGKVEGDRVTFEVAVGDKGVISFDLAVSGDELKGEVQMKRTGVAEIEKHKVALKKVN